MFNILWMPADKPCIPKWRKKGDTTFNLPTGDVFTKYTFYYTYL
jgi:hypothetical protein